MSRARPVLSAALVLTFLPLVTATSGCKEEETRLFDEAGVWALEEYSLAGAGFQSIDQVRENRFLLRFSPGDGVVAAASCHAEGSSNGVNDATCSLNKAISTWDCRCFAYEFDESRMVWQEFAPGDEPSPVGDPLIEDSGAHELMVDAANAARTFQYFSLPEGLFDSDGTTSKHVFQIKADNLWTGVDVNEDGVLDLEACSMSCFPSMRE